MDASHAPLPIPYGPAELVGVLGFFLYVSTYTMLTLRVPSSASVTYFVLNLTASSCVLIGLTVSFNLAAALIQTFWVIMSVVGITLQVFHPMRRRY